MTQTDFLCLMPFLVIAIAPVVIMIIISVIRKYEITYYFTAFSLILAFASIFTVNDLLPHSIGTLVIIDIYSLFFLGVIILSALLVVILSYNYIRLLESNREEYYIIILTSTLGAALLAVAAHFVTFFLGLELLSVSLYILISFLKSRDSSIEAGFKYLILASVSSAFLLFGMALLYTAFGTMEFKGIRDAIFHDGSFSPLALSGFGMMIVGIGFKLALAPFHMWAPDVYQGAPSPVSAFVATVSKGAVMAVLIRFFFGIRGFENTYLFVMISVLAILSMSIGNLLALRQQNLKRLLAYSSIANMGYLVTILLMGSNQGIRAAIFFMVAYFITTLGAFGIISLVSAGKAELEQIAEYKGLFWKNPFIAVVMTIILLSLAGIPLTAGFIAKFYLVFEGMKSGLLLLVIALIINSVIGLYYYLRVITALFAPADELKFPEVTFTGKILLAMITLGIILLGVFPGFFLDVLVKWVVL